MRPGEGNTKFPILRVARGFLVSCDSDEFLAEIFCWHPEDLIDCVGWSKGA